MGKRWSGCLAAELVLIPFTPWFLPKHRLKGCDPEGPSRSQWEEVKGSILKGRKQTPSAALALLGLL